MSSMMGTPASFVNPEREKALAEIRSCGAIHCDSEWRNMLWDDLSGHLVVVDLEDVKWLKRPWALDCISDSTQRTRCVGATKYKPGFEKVEYKQYVRISSLWQCIQKRCKACRHKTSWSLS
ncbi:hypothetical protein ASPFODRAFT_205917 [Aspergillus luchuensis CBS 106.47]|uniref:Aminoglycoside phosphotransferase domain-containing protein n=1 Tax=Aspergillus luchuensis (strain CBS 106.47) TaxID=1137211 RepID=A0A1M3TQ03_ASPLC|nr:hypothetical protein ASPFODRAFT_205917 [Aspergillus luchuensis CBS 106.47]